MNNCGTVTLETRRLLLRRFVPEDAAAMYRTWASDPEVTRWLRWPCHTSPEETASVLRGWCFAYDEEPDYYNWAITLKETNALIGSISLLPESDGYEPGYALGRAYWGRGYATEALCAVTEFAFHTLQLPQLFCRHAAQNPASGKVMEHAGFVYSHDARCTTFDRKHEFVCRCYLLKKPLYAEQDPGAICSPGKDFL